MRSEGTQARDLPAAIFARTFPQMIETLRKPQRSRTRPPLSALRAAVAARLALDWELVSAKVERFKLNLPQARLEVEESFLNDICAHLCDRIRRELDRTLSGLFAKLHQGADECERALWLFGCLFLSHEVIHQEQRLTSFQYKDSDNYSRAVAAVDYQADIGGLDYVLSIVNPVIFDLSDREMLAILVYIHIVTMQFFAGAAQSGRISVSDLNRLLIWHYQLARLTAPSGPAHIDLLHPSLCNAPTLEFPNVIGLLELELQRNNLDLLLNNGSTTRQDIVLSAHDTDGLVRLTRLASTDDSRAASLLAGIMDERIDLVREGFQELFDDRPHLLEISSFKRSGALRKQLDAALDLAGSILAEDASNPGRLSLHHHAVLDLLSRIDVLFLTDLPGEGWEDYRAAFDPSGLAGMQKKAESELGARWRQRAKASQLSAIIRSEIVRLQIRLQWSADEV